MKNWELMLQVIIEKQLYKCFNKNNICRRGVIWKFL